jgi:uncharacterized protein (TIGR02246 family)
MSSSPQAILAEIKVERDFRDLLDTSLRDSGKTCSIIVISFALFSALEFWLKIQVHAIVYFMSATIVVCAAINDSQVAMKRRWRALALNVGQMKRSISIAAAVVVLVSAGCVATNNPAKVSTMRGQNEDIRAIKQLAADWRSGWLAGDADALLSLYGEEPVLMPQGQPAITGKDPIRALYRSVLKDFAITSESTLREIEVSGDWAYFWSTYTLTATPKAGGEPITSSGKSLFIVRRAPGGAWKIARLMDNSDR